MLFYTWLLRFRTTVEICSSLSCKSDSFSTLKITLLIWLLTTKSLCVRTSVLTSATSVFLSLCLYVHPTVRKSVRVTFLIYDHGASDATVNKKKLFPYFQMFARPFSRSYFLSFLWWLQNPHFISEHSCLFTFQTCWFCLLFSFSHLSWYSYWRAENFASTNSAIMVGSIGTSLWTLMSVCLLVGWSTWLVWWSVGRSVCSYKPKKGR